MLNDILYYHYFLHDRELAIHMLQWLGEMLLTLLQ